MRGLVLNSRKNSSRRGLLCKWIACGIDCGHFCLKLCYFAVADGWRGVRGLIPVEVQWPQLVWTFVSLVLAHGEECMICGESQQLQLQYVTPHVAANNEHYFPPIHLIEVFVPVAAYLAHYSLEEVVGG